MKKPSVKKIEQALAYWNAWPIGLRPMQEEYLDALHYAASQYVSINKVKK